MLKQQLAFKYAKALFDEALEKSEEGEIQKSLDRLSPALSSSGVQAYFVTPSVSKKTKSQFLRSLCEKCGLQITVESFLNVLLDGNRFEIFQDIAREYTQLLDRHQNVERVLIYSVILLTTEQQRVLVEKLNKIWINKGIIKLENRLDLDLIGGLRLHWGNRVLDLSLGAALNKLAQTGFLT